MGIENMSRRPRLMLAGALLLLVTCGLVATNGATDIQGSPCKAYGFTGYIEISISQASLTPNDFQYACNHAQVDCSISGQMIKDKGTCVINMPPCRFTAKGSKRPIAGQCVDMSPTFDKEDGIDVSFQRQPIQTFPRTMKDKPCDGDFEGESFAGGNVTTVCSPVTTGGSRVNPADPEKVMRCCIQVEDVDAAKKLDREEAAAAIKTTSPKTSPGDSDNKAKVAIVAKPLPTPRPPAAASNMPGMKVVQLSEVHDGDVIALESNWPTKGNGHPFIGVSTDKHSDQVGLVTTFHKDDGTWSGFKEGEVDSSILSKVFKKGVVVKDKGEIGRPAEYFRVTIVGEGEEVVWMLQSETTGLFVTHNPHCPCDKSHNFGSDWQCQESKTSESANACFLVTAKVAKASKFAIHTVAGAKWIGLVAAPDGDIHGGMQSGDIMQLTTDRTDPELKAFAPVESTEKKMMTHVNKKDPKKAQWPKKGQFLIHRMEKASEKGALSLYDHPGKDLLLKDILVQGHTYREYLDSRSSLGSEQDSFVSVMKKQLMKKLTTLDEHGLDWTPGVTVTMVTPVSSDKHELKPFGINTGLQLSSSGLGDGATIPQMIVSIAVEQKAISSIKEQDICVTLKDAQLEDGRFDKLRVAKCMEDTKPVSRPDAAAGAIKPECKSTCKKRRVNETNDPGACGCFCECMAKEMVFAITKSLPFKYNTETAEKSFTSHADSCEGKMYTIDKTGKWSVDGEPVKADLIAGGRDRTLGSELMVGALLDFVPSIPGAPDCRESYKQVPALKHILKDEVSYRGDAQKQMEFCKATEGVDESCTESCCFRRLAHTFGKYATRKMASFAEKAVVSTDVLEGDREFGTERVIKKGDKESEIVVDATLDEISTHKLGDGTKDTVFNMGSIAGILPTSVLKECDDEDCKRFGKLWQKTTGEVALQCFKAFDGPKHEAHVPLESLAETIMRITFYSGENGDEAKTRAKSSFKDNLKLLKDPQKFSWHLAPIIQEEREQIEAACAAGNDKGTKAYATCKKQYNVHYGDALHKITAVLTPLCSEIHDGAVRNFDKLKTQLDNMARSLFRVRKAVKELGETIHFGQVEKSADFEEAVKENEKKPNQNTKPKKHTKPSKIETPSSIRTAAASTTFMEITDDSEEEEESKQLKVVEAPKESKDCPADCEEGLYVKITKINEIEKKDWHDRSLPEIRVIARHMKDRSPFPEYEVVDDKDAQASTSGGNKAPEFKFKECFKSEKEKEIDDISFELVSTSQASIEERFNAIKDKVQQVKECGAYKDKVKTAIDACSFCKTLETEKPDSEDGPNTACFRPLLAAPSSKTEDGILAMCKRLRCDTDGKNPVELFGIAKGNYYHSKDAWEKGEAATSKIMGGSVNSKKGFTVTLGSLEYSVHKCNKAAEVATVAGVKAKGKDTGNHQPSDSPTAAGTEVIDEDPRTFSWSFALAVNQDLKGGPTVKDFWKEGPTYKLDSDSWVKISKSVSPAIATAFNSEPADVKITAMERGGSESAPDVEITFAIEIKTKSKLVEIFTNVQAALIEKGEQPDEKFKEAYNVKIADSLGMPVSKVKPPSRFSKFMKFSKETLEKGKQKLDQGVEKVKGIIKKEDKQVEVKEVEDERYAHQSIWTENDGRMKKKFVQSLGAEGDTWCEIMRGWPLKVVDAAVKIAAFSKLYQVGDDKDTTEHNGYIFRKDWLMIHNAFTRAQKCSHKCSSRTGTKVEHKGFTPFCDCMMETENTFDEKYQKEMQQEIENSVKETKIQAVGTATKEFFKWSKRVVKTAIDRKRSQQEVASKAKHPIRFALPKEFGKWLDQGTVKAGVCSTDAISSASSKRPTAQRELFQGVEGDDVHEFQSQLTKTAEMLFGPGPPQLMAMSSKTFDLATQINLKSIQREFHVCPSGLADSAALSMLACAECKPDSMVATASDVFKNDLETDRLFVISTKNLGPDSVESPSMQTDVNKLRCALSVFKQASGGKLMELASATEKSGFGDDLANAVKKFKQIYMHDFAEVEVSNTVDSDTDLCLKDMFLNDILYNDVMVTQYVSCLPLDKPEDGKKIVQSDSADESQESAADVSQDGGDEPENSPAAPPAAAPPAAVTAT